MPRIGKPDLKETLLMTGLRCFARKGYQATTLDEIAAEAQVTKGAVYWHYKDKAELFACVIQERINVLIAEVDRAVTEAAEPVGRLRAFLEIVFAFYADNPEFAALLGLLRSGPDSALGPCVPEEVRAFYRKIRAAWSQVIEAGIRQGAIAEGPPEVLTAWLLATIDGVILQWVIDPEALDLRAMTPTLVERTLRGLLVLPQAAEKNNETLRSCNLPVTPGV